MKTRIIRFKGKLGKVIRDENGKDRFLPVSYGNYYPQNLEIIEDNKVDIATFNDKIEYITKEFVWGEIKKVHCIGDFQIIESMDRESKKIEFHPYIDFDNMSVSCKHLDIALIEAISHKYLGKSAGYYFCKMLGIEID